MVERNRDVSKRMNFSDRQFLRAQDFIDEQDYHLDRHRRHNRLLHSPGVGEGLEVSSSSAEAVQVSAGTAIDDQGREIVLLTPGVVPMPEGVTGPVDIYITYGEETTDPSSDPGATDIQTRVTESPTFATVVPPKLPPPSSVLLARVTLSNGQLTGAPDNTVKIPAGAVVGSLVINGLTALTLTLKGDGVASSQWPRLSCSQAHQTTLENSSLRLEANREIIFGGNAQIKSLDDNHRLTFNHQHNQLELHELGDISFYTGAEGPGGIERMRILANGHIGIGTPNPTQLVTLSTPEGTRLEIARSSTTLPWGHVRGPVNPGAFIINQQSQGSSAPGADFALMRDGKIRVALGDVDTYLSSQEGPNGIAGNIRFFVNVEEQRSREAMRITGSGRVGIGTINPEVALHVLGDVKANNFPGPSDARFKTNVMPLTDVLEKLERIRGVSFDWNELSESLGCTPGCRGIGVIAQEVEAVFPELVTIGGDEEYRAIDYGKLTAVLIEAVKEVKAETTALRQRTEALEMARALGSAKQSSLTQWPKSNTR